MPNFPRLMWYLAGAMKRVSWNRQKLRDYQERRLRAVVRYAYQNVLFYHNHFRRAGLLPDVIKTLEDLNRIPIVRKEDVKLHNPPELVSKEFDSRKLKVIRTSGSTGQPFKTFINRKEDDWRKAIYMRANISCGQKPRDRWVILTSPHHFSDTSLIQRRLRLFGQNCVSVFASLEEQIEFVSGSRPDVLDGYSGSLLLLAKGVQQRGVRTIRPRIIFGTADLIDTPSQRFIERVFEAPFYDQFGCAELDRTAWQCPEKLGYHMDVDSVITQFVDEGGNEVSSGENGEIVYTSLFNYAQPLIRYGVKDVGKPLDDSCPCCRKLPLMKVVEGRTDSFLVFPNGELLSPMGFWSIMRLFGYADHIDQFQVVQKQRDLVEILVKKADDKLSDSVLRDKLIGHIRKCVGPENSSSSSFHVSFVDRIPLSRSGKLQSVIGFVYSQENLKKEVNLA
jgi:phenylacetate-CoA ligase